MRFLSAGETARMDAQRREDILSLISAGREIEAAAILHPRIVMSSPEVPVDPQIQALSAASKIFDSYDPVVRAIEARLRKGPGPTWRDLTAQEAVALSGWAKAADQMGQTVPQNAPESSWNTGVVLLIVLAVGAILAPILLSGGGRADSDLPLRSEAPASDPSYGRGEGWAMHRGEIPRRSVIVSAREED